MYNVEAWDLSACLSLSLSVCLFIYSHKYEGIIVMHAVTVDKQYDDVTTTK